MATIKKAKTVCEKCGYGYTRLVKGINICAACGAPVETSLAFEIANGLNTGK